MANAIQIILGIVVLGLLTVGAFVMHWLFGLMGIVLFLVFMVPMFGFVWYLSDGSGGQTTQGSNRVSKGAKQSRED